MVNLPAIVPDAGARHGPPRIALVDLARGVALLAMVVFHFAWDLSFLRFIATDVAAHPGWRLFSQSIAFSFLALAGLSLGLAHANGLKAPAFWRRFGVIALAAAAVSLATWLAFPQAWVAFGILHCIAAASLLCLPFLKRPAWLPLVAALLVASLPAAMDLPALVPLQEQIEASPFAALWAHLGLGRTPPLAVDFVPVFPWAAATLAGLGFGQWLARSGRAAALAEQALPPQAGALAWAGRRSLPIYLLHQPVLLGALMLVAWLAPGLTPSLQLKAEDRFRTDCVEACTLQGTQAICRSTCGCVVEELRRDPAQFRRAIGLAAPDAGTNAAVAMSSRICIGKMPQP